MFNANDCIFKISTTHYLPGYLSNIKTKMTLMMTWHLCARVCWKENVWLRKPGHHVHRHVGDHRVYHHHHQHLTSPSNNKNFVSTTATLPPPYQHQEFCKFYLSALMGCKGTIIPVWLGRTSGNPDSADSVIYWQVKICRMVIISNSILSFFQLHPPYSQPHQPIEILLISIHWQYWCTDTIQRIIVTHFAWVN